MSKVLITDVPAAIRSICTNIRNGLRQVRDNNILLVTEPKTIDLEFDVIVRKDDLQRLELSSRDATITTTTSGTTSETKTESAAISVTDGTETTSGTTTGTESGTESGTASGTQSGTESSTESGTESGGSAGGQSGSSDDGGGETETYTYESDS